MGSATFIDKINDILQTSSDMSGYERKVNNFPHTLKSLLELKLLFKFKKQ